MDRNEADALRGEEAQRLMNSPLLAEAFDTVRRAYIDALEVLPTDATGDEEAKDYRRKLAAIADVKTVLTKYVESGHMAQKTLSAREKITERARGAFTNLTQRNRSR